MEKKQSSGTPSNSSKPDQSSVDLTSPKASSSPSMPNERDESQGMTGGVPSADVQQAHKDVERGLKDTSRGDEADSTYRKLKK